MIELIILVILIILLFTRSERLGSGRGEPDLWVIGKELSEYRSNIIF